MQYCLFEPARGRSGIRPTATSAAAIRNVRSTSISLKNSFSWRQRLVSSAAVCEAKLCLFASGGEDRRRMRNELRQFPEILGGGCQQELIFGSVWTAEAQTTEPEDALQMSEEHLDLFSFAT